MSKKLWFIKSCLILIIGVLFLGLENVIGMRRIYLISLFAGILIMSYIRYKKSDARLVLTLVLDGFFVLLIGLFSRYVVNYYVYILYMLILAEGSYSYDIKYAKFPVVVISLLTIYHYYALLMYRMNLGTVSEILFMVLINILIVVTFILARQQQSARLKVEKLNEELRSTNHQLEKLTRLEVKHQIARDIHDTFGHDMMGLIMEIEMADVLMDEDLKEAKVMLNSAKSSARKGMKTIRKVVETLRNDDSIISETLDEMVAVFSKRMPIEVHVSIDKSIYNQSKKIHDTLYRLVQECMTNTVRHSHASLMSIEISIEEKIEFSISDNGIGFNELQLGYGLTGMKERIELIGGQITFSSEHGFTVRGTI